MSFHKNNNVNKLATMQYNLGVLFVAKAVLIMKGNTRETLNWV